MLKHNVHTFVSENHRGILQACEIHVQSNELDGINNYCEANTLFLLINDINSNEETDEAQRSRKFYYSMIEKLEKIVNSRKNDFERLFLAYIIPEDHHDQSVTQHSRVQVSRFDSDSCDSDVNTDTSTDVGTSLSTDTDTDASNTPNHVSFYAALLETSMWLLEVAEGFRVIDISITPSLLMGVENKIFLCEYVYEKRRRR